MGQYSAGKPSDGTWYALSGGCFVLGDGSSPSLDAQRWYMTKTSKGDPASLKSRALQLMTLGEDNEATAIVATRIQKGQAGQNGIYTPSGIRLARPQKGFNIIGGKTILVK